MAGNQVNFTKGNIESIPLPEKGYIMYHDTGTPGLVLRVYPSGRKTFYLYRKVNGKPEYVKIGFFPKDTPENARKRAKDINSEITLDMNSPEKMRSKKVEYTLRETFESFIQLHAKGHKKTWQADEWQFNKYLSHWSTRKLSSFQHNDIKALHAKIGTDHGLYTANRVFALLNSLFTFARRMGFTDKENPCIGIQKFREEKRDRFLQESELPRFFDALMKEQDTAARDCIFMMLLTGQRRSCVLSMRWDEIDLKRAEWRIPPEKMKSKEIQRVPLVIEAVRILLARNAKSESEWVFPSARIESHILQPKNSWRRVLMQAEISDLHFHDLRRSLASYMAITGASLLTIAQMLGHSIASQSVTGIYARLSIDPIRQAMETAVRAMLRKGGMIPEEESVIEFKVSM
jgi:integrase